MSGYLLAAVALAVAVWLLVGRERSLALVFGAPRFGAVDFATLRKTPKPNQYLLSPAGLGQPGEADAVSPEFSISASELRDKFLGVALNDPLTERVASNDRELQYDISQKTPLMRYTDMITVRFIPLGEERSTLAVYSRSWYGRKDFGANRARVERWLRAII